MTREKQLTIALLTEKLQKLTGKKVIIKENNSENLFLSENDILGKYVNSDGYMEFPTKKYSIEVYGNTGGVSDRKIGKYSKTLTQPLCKVAGNGSMKRPNYRDLSSEGYRVDPQNSELNQIKENLKNGKFRNIMQLSLEAKTIGLSGTGALTINASSVDEAKKIIENELSKIKISGGDYTTQSIAVNIKEITPKEGGYLVTLEGTFPWIYANYQEGILKNYNY